MVDSINHPSHYGGSEDPYEAIKVIEAWDLNFCLGNCLKYIRRADEKGGILDLKKALWYLAREIENKEKDELTGWPDGGYPDVAAIAGKFSPKSSPVGRQPHPGTAASSPEKSPSPTLFETTRHRLEHPPGGESE